MAQFGTYYTLNMLSVMKWPRKQGMMGKEVFNTELVDHTIDQMLDWGASLGAGKPKLALKVLTHIYGARDWDSEEAPDIATFILSMNQEFETEGINLSNTAPHALIDHVKLANHYKETLPVKVMSDDTIISMIETGLALSLLYGLTHPDEYEDWYETQLTDFQDNKANFEMMNLEVEQPPLLAANYENSAAIIALYVSESGIQLPEPVPQLVTIIRNFRS